jgi:4-hydroxybenzoyl-CoA thioesterase
MFANVYRFTIEWGDCDPAGIVFYPRFFAMFDAATAHLLEAASGMTRAELIRSHGILGWPMVNAQADFRASASFDDRVEIRTRVERLGRSSMVFAHELWRGDTLCVDATETRVWAAHGDGARAIVPQALPDALRAQLNDKREEHHA